MLLPPAARKALGQARVVALSSRLSCACRAATVQTRARSCGARSPAWPRWPTSSRQRAGPRIPMELISGGARRAAAEQPRTRLTLRPRPARLRAPRGPRAPQPGKTRRVCSRPAATRTPAMCANPRRRRLQGATGRQLGPRPARPTRAAAGAQRCLGAAHAPHRRGPTPLLARAAVPALAGRRLTPRAEPAPEARRRSPHPGRGGARRRRLRRGGRAARRRPCWGGAARAGAQARRACLACGRPRGAVIRRGPLWRVGAGGLRARQRSAAGGRGPGLVSA